MLWEKYSHLPTQSSRKERYPWGRNLPSPVCKKSNQIKSTPSVTIKVYKAPGALSNLSPMSFFIEFQPSKKYTSQSIKTICSGKGEVRAQSLWTARKGSKPNPGNGSTLLVATGVSWKVPVCDTLIPHSRCMVVLTSVTLGADVSDTLRSQQFHGPEVCYLLLIHPVRMFLGQWAFPPHGDSEIWVLCLHVLVTKICPAAEGQGSGTGNPG